MMSLILVLAGWSILFRVAVVIILTVFVISIIVVMLWQAQNG